MFQGFKQFILKGNVVDLAVGVVVGVAFNAVVTALVKDIITPLIGAIGGQPDFSAITVTINNSKILFGDFMNALVSFLIVATVIYFAVVLPMNRINSITKKQKNVDPTTKKCPECLSIVQLDAKRCPYCTSNLNTN